MVSPSVDRHTIEVSTASGIDTVMISVERQLPRNSRIISAVSAAAMTPSRATPDDGRLDEDRLVDQRSDVQSGRRAGLDHRQQRLDVAMMSSVETVPFFCIVVSTECRPLTRTRFCCGE